MCTVLLPPGGYPIAVKYIISYNTNAELNPICHLLALVGTHHILHVSRIRVNNIANKKYMKKLSRGTFVSVFRSNAWWSPHAQISGQICL
jgi:hypothetical protein